MIYAKPGTAGAVVALKPRYGNYIGGEFVASLGDQYFTTTSLVDGSVIAQFPRSDAKDIDKALDAAHSWAGQSRPGAYGSTATTYTRRIPPSVATRSPASAARTTSWPLSTISRPRTCW